MFLRIDDKARRGLAAVAFTGAAFFALFWALYFAGVIAPSDPNDPIARFEAAFPIADALLTATLLVAGVGLMRRRFYGLFCMVGGAGMTLYLGLLDLTFYAGSGAYSPPVGDGWVELAVNVLCLGGGAAGLWFCWNAWRKSWERDTTIVRPRSSRRWAA
jgi:hypothetical protein